MARHCAMFEAPADSARTWVEFEAPPQPHDEVAAHLVARLRDWSELVDGGAVLLSGHEISVADRRGAPVLVVEVVTPTGPRSDRLTRHGWYAQLGVTEHWLVDPQARTLERLLLRGGSYFVVEFLTKEESFRPPTFPGLEIELATLWA